MAGPASALATGIRRRRWRRRVSRIECTLGRGGRGLAFVGALLSRGFCRVSSGLAGCLRPARRPAAEGAGNIVLEEMRDVALESATQIVEKIRARRDRRQRRDRKHGDGISKARKPRSFGGQFSFSLIVAGLKREPHPTQYEVRRVPGKDPDRRGFASASNYKPGWKVSGRASIHSATASDHEPTLRGRRQETPRNR